MGVRAWIAPTGGQSDRSVHDLKYTVRGIGRADGVQTAKSLSVLTKKMGATIEVVIYLSFNDLANSGEMRGV